MRSTEVINRLKEREVLTDGEVIDLCFRAMKELTDPKEQSRAALILSGMVQKGLGSKTQEFLEEHSDLPRRVHEILISSVLRMEGF